MTPLETDPITQIHDAIWNVIKSSTVVQELVKKKNQIRFSDDLDKTPLKQHISPSDLPEIQVWSEAAGGGPSSSDSDRFTRQFTVVLITGSYQVHVALFPLEWALFSAFTRWQDFLGPLRYKDQPFVVSCRPLGATIGDSDPERNRGVKGWTALWRFEVTCEFNREQTQP